MNLPAITGRTVDELAAQLRDWHARIGQVFGRDHFSDGTHILPRWVSGVWGTNLGASTFIGSGSQTWTVSQSQATTFDWWKHGTGMQVNFMLVGTTVGGAAADHVSFYIPDNFTAAHSARNVIQLDDGSGTSAAGVAVVTKNGRTVDIYRMTGANFTGGTVTVIGQIQFRTTN